MTDSTAILSQVKQPGSLLERLRTLGIVAICCDNQGRITSSAAAGDPITTMLHASPIFTGALARAAQGWMTEQAPAVVEIFPGCHLSPSPELLRRKRVGYLVAVLLTPDVLSAEQFPAMCQSASLDFEHCRNVVRRLPPVEDADIARLSGMIALAHEDAAIRASNDESLRSFGQQLSESYEEISLLYTMTRNITDVDQPQRFIQLACEELLATLPFAWVSAIIRDGQKPTRVADELIVAGKAPVAPSKLRDIFRSLVDELDPLAAMVIDPQRVASHQRLACLGNAALIQPITKDSRTIGMFAAGGKSGHDPVLSSGDMQLLAATATHTSIFIENASLYEDMNAMFLGTLEALTASIDAKDPYTCGHSQRVAHLTQQLARAIGLDKQTVQRMHIAGLVHDVGKIGVPEHVLTKPGRLTDEEFEAIKRHPDIGYRILKDIPQLQDVLPGVLHHHERWDGYGYPRGIAGTDIPLVARLIGLADSFDAMSSTRTYRSAMSRAEVLAEIQRCAGQQFDPDLAPVFTSLSFEEYDAMVIEHRANEPVAGPRLDDHTTEVAA